MNEEAQTLLRHLPVIVDPDHVPKIAVHTYELARTMGVKMSRVDTLVAYLKDNMAKGLILASGVHGYYLTKNPDLVQRNHITHKKYIITRIMRYKSSALAPVKNEYENVQLDEQIEFIVRQLSEVEP